MATEKTARATDVYDTKAFAKRLGEKLRFYRESGYFTQYEAAIGIGHSSAAYIAYIEDGKRGIKLSDLMALAKLYDASVFELLEMEGTQEEFLNLLPLASDLTTQQKLELEAFYRFLKSKSKS